MNFVGTVSGEMEYINEKSTLVAIRNRLAISRRIISIFGTFLSIIFALSIVMRGGTPIVFLWVLWWWMIWFFSLRMLKQVTRSIEKVLQ